MRTGIERETEMTTAAYFAEMRRRSMRAEGIAPRQIALVHRLPGGASRIQGRARVWRPRKVNVAGMLIAGVAFGVIVAGSALGIGALGYAVAHQPDPTPMIEALPDSAPAALPTRSRA